jgi:hypothetical protein
MNQRRQQGRLRLSNEIRLRKDATKPGWRLLRVTLDRVQERIAWNAPLHVDGRPERWLLRSRPKAGVGFSATRVASINTFGHKYGLKMRGAVSAAISFLGNFSAVGRSRISFHQ